MPVVLPLLPLGSWFPSDDWPRLPCGACAKGELRVGKPLEIDVSKRYRDHPGWEPDWIAGYFSVQAECTNSECRSIALVAGKMKVDITADSRRHSHGNFEALYQLRYCDPAVRLLTVPDGTPDDVRQLLESASQVIWMSPSSAANRLRAAIELMLDDLGVTKRGSTHQRIKRLSASKPEFAAVLEAVKWIGNDGSHTVALPLPDVLEGVALLERALTLAYDRSGAELEERAREINDERRRRRTPPTKPAPTRGE